MKIEILYFEGCPHYELTLELVRSVVTDKGMAATVESVEVNGPEDAERRRFFGSPSVHVDGVDVDPAARSRSDYAYGCRKYGTSGIPTKEMIEAALTAGGLP